MPENHAFLEVNNLLVFYENALALNNIALKCQEGKVTGVFGSNSAGKTSLARAVSGLIVHMSRKEKMVGGEKISFFGEILFDGENVLFVKPSKRAKKGIILCPERRRLFSESTVLENLKIGGYLATRRQARETMQYVFEIFPELLRLKSRRGGFLSGGEQQMVAIGRALMAQPRLLMLDEPLLGLAPVVEKRLAKSIKEISGNLGFTILITEQYARPLLPVVDYCYVLETGTIAFEGTHEAFMNTPEAVDAYFGGVGANNRNEVN